MKSLMKCVGRVGGIPPQFKRLQMLLRVGKGGIAHCLYGERAWRVARHPLATGPEGEFVTRWAASNGVATPDLPDLLVLGRRVIQGWVSVAAPGPRRTDMSERLAAAKTALGHLVLSRLRGWRSGG
jgi:hypothetical protein